MMKKYLKVKYCHRTTSVESFAFDLEIKQKANK